MRDDLIEVFEGEDLIKVFKLAVNLHEIILKYFNHIYKIIKKLKKKKKQYIYSHQFKCNLKNNFFKTQKLYECNILISHKYKLIQIHYTQNKL